VDDPLLVGVLHRLADLAEQLQAVAELQARLVAELGDRHALDQLHHEVRPAARGRPAVEHLGDVGMVHQRQRLALRLEARDHLLGVHAQLDDLERHLAPDRLELLGHPDRAHAALADLLQELEVADHVTRLLAGPLGRGRRDGLRRRCCRRLREEIAHSVARLEQRHHARGELLGVAAQPPHELGALRRRLLQRELEDLAGPGLTHFSFS